MKNEQKLTDFNDRVQQLRTVTGKSQAAIAAMLEVSRTTLHYYCTGQSEPKASALFRLDRAERVIMSGLAALPPDATAAGKFSDHPLPEEPEATVGADDRTMVELKRHLEWLLGARRRQQEAVMSAQTHLHEIEQWVHDAEERLAEGGRRKAERGERKGKVGRTVLRGKEHAQMRDIATVSLPIFGALPAGWPQTREGVAARRALRTVRVKRGRFPEGAFGLEVRGDSMNAARPMPIYDRDIVVLLSPEQRPPRHDDIVAALIDGETCLKRLKSRRKGGAFLQSESTNPTHGTLRPTHDLVIQGVLVGKI